jgi:hypothetical protein
MGPFIALIALYPTLTIIFAEVYLFAVEAEMIVFELLKTVLT